MECWVGVFLVWFFRDVIFEDKQVSYPQKIRKTHTRKSDEGGENVVKCLGTKGGGATISSYKYRL